MRNILIVSKSSSCFEPINTISHQSKLRDDSLIYITTLISTPADKAGTPLNSSVKAVPLTELESTLQVKTRIVQSDGRDFVYAIIGR